MRSQYSIHTINPTIVTSLIVPPSPGTQVCANDTVSYGDQDRVTYSILSHNNDMATIQMNMSADARTTRFAQIGIYFRYACVRMCVSLPGF